MDRLRLVNDGDRPHGYVAGMVAENARHAEAMRECPGMRHDEPRMAHVKPGAIVGHFDRAGSFEFARPVAGQCDAGSRGVVTVER